MPITVIEDESESGGFALVDVGALAAAPLPGLSIRRLDAEPRHLGPDGWQPEVVWLTPLSADSVAGRTIVRFGPNVVDRISDLVPIEIVEEGGRSFGVVQWPYITPAPQGAGVLIGAPVRPSPSSDTIHRPGLEAQEQPALPPGDKAEPLPPLTPAAAKPMSPIAESRRVLPPPPPARGGAGRAILAVLILLVVAAAAGGTYLYRDRLFPATTVAAPQAPRIDVAELERQYAVLLQGRAPSSELLAFGDRAIEAGHSAVAFRAFEEADPATSEEAAWQLARFYDPRVTEGPFRSASVANPARAAYYHALWKERSTRHTDELRALCDLGQDAAARERLRAFCQT